MAGLSIGAYQTSASVGAYQSPLAAAVSLTPATLALVTASFAASIAISNNIAISPSVAALSTSGKVATVAISDNINLTPASVALSTSGKVSDVVASANIGLTPASVALSTSGKIAVVGTSNAINLAPASVELTTSGKIAVAQVSNNVGVTPGTLALSTSGKVLSLSVSGNLALTPNVVALTTSGKLPVISTTANISLTPAISQLTTTGHAPSTGQATLGAHESMHNRIRSRFNDQIATAGVVSRVVYDNENETPPSNLTWIECSVEDTDTELIANGGKQTYRKRGELRATINGPLGMGDAASLRVCDAVRTAFNRTIDGSVHYGVTSVGGFNRVDQYWQMVTLTPFYSDDAVAKQANVGSWTLLDREAAFNSVRSRFNTLFGSSGSVSSNAVIYDNDPAKPPSDSQWIHFSVNTGASEIVGAGANAWTRTAGIATAMILSPLGVGNKTPLALADTIVQKFRSITDSGVVYETPFLSSVGRRNQWWQTNCNIRFRLEEVVQ